MMTILNNRERAFRAALESVRVTTEKLIRRLDFDLTEGIPDAKVDTLSEEIGSAEDLLFEFDDAIEEVATARNSYIAEAEIDLGEMEASIASSK